MDGPTPEEAAGNNDDLMLVAAILTDDDGAGFEPPGGGCLPPCQTGKQVADAGIQTTNALFLDTVGDGADEQIPRQRRGSAVLKSRPPERPEIVEAEAGDLLQAWFEWFQVWR